MDQRNKQIPRPKHWQEFEELCLVLFSEIWKDRLAKKNGRSGQAQHGVDVWGAVEGNHSRFQGVQCKGKDQALGTAVTRAELLDEIAKADGFSPKLDHWILATTGPADGEIEKVAREISVERKREGRFTVQVMGWSDLETLMCSHPVVLRNFYPELGLDTAALVDAVQHLTNLASTKNDFPQVAAGRRASHRGWREIAFGSLRDIGPALLGRPLGPTDALACPRLPEVNHATRQLQTAFSARLVGDPGTGKSVCAYQIANVFAQRGWIAYAIRGTDSLPDLPVNVAGRNTLLLIDDAHLVAEDELLALESHATARQLVLSTHTITDGQATQRGAVRMEPKAGIRTIAAGLLAQRSATLEAVRRADSHVGELMMDVALEERIEHAEKYSSSAWQFCFVLGGGWRRANEAAHTAAALGAEMPLAAIAIRQLASRDARCSEAEIESLLASASIDTKGLRKALRSLVAERLVLATDDLRCPHQRLAGVVLGGILSNQGEQGFLSIRALWETALGDSTFPIGGLGSMLHELSFSNTGRWRYLARDGAFKTLAQRCWAMTEPQDRSAACFVLSEIAHCIRGGSATLLRDHETTLISWIEEAAYPTGFGLSRFLNTLPQYKQERVLNLTRSVAPAAMAKLISNVDSSTIDHVISLADCLSLGADDAWAKAVIEGIDRKNLVALAKGWPKDEPTYKIVGLFRLLVWPLEDFALDLVEAFLPITRAKFEADPISEFAHLHDLAWHVLRVLDFLGIYKGALGPKTRHIRIAREFFNGLDLTELASKLSKAPLRKLQELSYILGMLKRVSPAKFRTVVPLLNWDELASSFGEHWRHLPHDAEVLIGVASATPETQQIAANFVRRNVERMEVMPARLAVVAPTVAIEFVRSGKQIALASSIHVDWVCGAFIVTLFVKEAPELLTGVLAQCIPVAAKSLSATHPSSFERSFHMLEAVRVHAPEILEKILNRIDVEGAAVGWRAALKHSKATRETANLLIAAAHGRPDALGDLARKIRPARRR